MGVTCVLRWKNANGKPNFNFIQDHVRTGAWGITCKVYRDASPRAKQGTDKLMYQVSLSQHRDKVFVMVDGGVVVEAERELEGVLGKLKNLWILRQNHAIDGGSCYEVGDFTIRAANIILGGNYKGLLLEVEYRPLSTPNAATPLIEEFVRNIMPANAELSYQIESDYEKVGLSARVFSPAHTAYQYMTLMRRDGLL